MAILRFLRRERSPSIGAERNCWLADGAQSRLRQEQRRGTPLLHPRLNPLRPSQQGAARASPGFSLGFSLFVFESMDHHAKLHLKLIVRYGKGFAIPGVVNQVSVSPFESLCTGSLRKLDR